MESRQFVQSLQKGLDVLLAFGPDRIELSLPQIAEAAGITKSAAQRFAITLHALGYLQKDVATKRYSLTAKVMDLGHRYLVTDRFLERASPYALELNRRCHETVNVAKADDTDMVYLGRFPSTLHMPVYMPVGRRLPMYCTSAGRAYLSALPAVEARALIEASPRQAHTRTSVTSVSRLMGLIEDAQAAGFAIAEGEYYEGDLGIGVAIRDGTGRPVGAINISCPSVRWTVARMRRELAPLLMETARLVSTTPPPAKMAAPFLLGAGRLRPRRSAAGH